ncbi:acyl carrier protein [Kitasatospora viridis]|uniref:Acyl carrier protein n=1 Tax=Kitasatospora viridis TaxID=281105 RepID=A0A561UIU7_9ACTN|nr:acyl carrier protein [Kitasatospora viridis]TWF99264.1 acyl carrier protein [Kitasatospora viridis]
MNDDVYTFLTEVLADMNYDTAAVTPETELGPNGLDMESLAIAEVSIQVEDRYGVKFEEDEAEQLALMNLGQLVEEIVKRAAAVAK